MKKVLLFIILSSLLLTGCKEEEKEPVQETVQKTDISIVTNNKFRFVDAHGEWHETTIDPNVTKHNYDWSCLENTDTEISYSDQNYHIRKGIDVAKYQGEIDWNQVKADGYEFAIVRLGFRGYVGDGSLNLDSFYEANVQGARDAGLDVGIYFFSQAITEEEAVEEAEFVLENLKNYDVNYPVVYDPELIKDEPDARTNNVSGEQFTKNTIAFCEKIKEAGYQPMIYSNMIWEAELFDMAKLQDYPFWYADYEKIPQTPYHFQMWQYSESGSVAGITGNVDLNIEFIPTKK